MTTKDGVVYKDCDFSRVSSSAFLHQVDKQNIMALNPTDINGKCIFMDVGGRQFVCRLPCRLYGEWWKEQSVHGFLLNCIFYRFYILFPVLHILHWSLKTLDTGYSIRCSIEYSIRYSIRCSIGYLIGYYIRCSIGYSIWYFIDHSIGYSILHALLDSL